MRLLLLALALVPAGAIRSGDITITTADDVKRARSLAIKETAGQLAVEYVDLNGRSETIKCSDVVEIGLDAPPAPTPAPGPADVELVTTAGDSIFGALAEPQEGRVAIASAALGTAAFPFENVDQVRFLANRATWP